MIWLQLLLACLLPFVSSENGTTSSSTPDPLVKLFSHPEELVMASVPNDKSDVQTTIADSGVTTNSPIFSDNESQDLSSFVEVDSPSPNDDGRSHKSTGSVEETSQSAQEDKLSTEEISSQSEETPKEQTTIRKPEEISTKTYKTKKKILVARPKSSTEKLVLLPDRVESTNVTKTDENKDLEEGVTSTIKSVEVTTRTKSESMKLGRKEASLERSFQFPTTENYDYKLTTSSFAISNLQKLFNNNLLNVIDTSVRPVVEDTTEVFRKPTPARNNIRFESDYYGPTGQTDWVPLVSEKGANIDWSPAEGFTDGPTHLKTEVRPFPEIREQDQITTVKSLRSTTIRPPVPIQSVSTLSTLTSSLENFSSESVNNSSEEYSGQNFPPSGPSWALVSSLLTRPTAGTTEPSQWRNISTPGVNDNAIIRKGEVQNVIPRISTTERYKLENATKEHNQVLKNTIPDSIVVETTPTPSRRRTTSFTHLPGKSTEMTKTVETTPETTSSRSTDAVFFPATEDFVDVEQTIAYEILKTSTLVPSRESSTTEASLSKSEHMTTESIENGATNFDVAMSSSSEMQKSTTTPVFETNKKNEVSSEDDGDVTSTEEMEIHTTYPTTTSRRPFSRRPLVKSTAIPIMSTTTPAATSTTTSSTTKTEETTTPLTTPKILPIIVPDITTMREELPTTTMEPEAAIIYEVSKPDQPEKTEDDSIRTILANETYEVATTELPLEPFGDEITEESVPAYLRLTVQTSEMELCERLPELRRAILLMLSEGTQTNVTSDHLVLLNLNHHICDRVLKKENPEDGFVRSRPVNMFLMDTNGNFNKNLSEAFLSLWGHAGLDFPLPILKVDFVTPIIMDEGTGDGLSGSMVAAIVISCVAAVCLVLLAILFIIMKRRQRKFNYGQRCTPVSLDAYSLDSVSIRNSGRRKGIRASKRSYGNAAFDDPEVPSHPMNFAGLANQSLAKEELFEEFSVIPQVSARPEEYPVGVETKNRYANVIPLPETRVVLSTRDGEPLSDYINANFVRGLNGVEKTYIAAQAPLDSTLPDWWRMIWENQVKVILMLTALQENGVEKCADYLPPNEVTDSLRLFGDYQIMLKKRDVKEKYIVSSLQIKNLETNLWREVTHLWYVGWPDSGVPAEPNSLIAFLIEARSEMKATNGVVNPTLVHCSPGTGRTGTVIACDLCIREFEQKRLVDIPRCVYNLRKARAGAVQTRDQYAFIYQVLNTYATKLTSGALE